MYLLVRDEKVKNIYDKYIDYDEIELFQTNKSPNINIWRLICFINILM